MIREIITPKSNEHTIHIPQEYINTKIEILVLPFSYPIIEEKKESKKSIFEKTSGLLISKNIDPLAWQDEMRSEWDR